MQKMTEFIEKERRLRRITVDVMSAYMEIGRDSYYRRIDKESSGFTEKELVGGSKLLGFRMVLIPEDLL